MRVCLLYPVVRGDAALSTAAHGRGRGVEPSTQRAGAGISVQSALLPIRVRVLSRLL